MADDGLVIDICCIIVNTVFSVVADNQFVQTTLLSVIYKLYLFCYHSLKLCFNHHGQTWCTEQSAIVSNQFSLSFHDWIICDECGIPLKWVSKSCFLSLKVVITEKTLNRVTLTPRIRMSRAYQLYLCGVLVKVWVGLLVLQRQLFFHARHTQYTPTSM